MVCSEQAVSIDSRSKRLSRRAHYVHFAAAVPRSQSLPSPSYRLPSPSTLLSIRPTIRQKTLLQTSRGLSAGFPKIHSCLLRCAVRSGRARITHLVLSASYNCLVSAVGETNHSLDTNAFPTSSWFLWLTF